MGAQAELEGPDFPDAVAYLWGYFVQLDAHRRPGEPLTWPDMQAWSWTHDVQLEPHEYDALMEIDETIRSVAQEAEKAVTKEAPTT